jgi:hypothetical protein
LLLILLILFSTVTLVLAGYGLVTGSFAFQGYMMLFLGLTMLVMGIQEIQKNKKLIGWLLIGVFGSSLYVSIQSFLLH